MGTPYRYGALLLPRTHRSRMLRAHRPVTNLERHDALQERKLGCDIAGAMQFGNCRSRTTHLRAGP